MMNVVAIAGRMVRDADLRFTNSGKAAANFTLAVDNPFNKDDAQFISCTSWGNQAEALANYTNKGSKVGVEGRLETRSYENKEGKNVFVTEVIANRTSFLDSKKDSQQNTQNNQQQNDPFADKGEPVDIEDSDLPF